MKRAALSFAAVAATIFVLEAAAPIIQLAYGQTPAQREDSVVNNLYSQFVKANTKNPVLGEPLINVDPKWIMQVRKEALAGNARAQDVMGNLHIHYGAIFRESGKSAWDDLRHDSARAAYWFRKAADQKIEDAQNQLGFLYYSGEGLSRNFAQAAYWFRKAADQGSVDAQDQLGVMYYLGQGVPQDHAQAVHWFRSAAEQGSWPDQLKIASSYCNGDGVPQDFSKSAYWYWKASEKGGGVALTKIARNYYEGGCGFPKNYTQAANFYRKAADRGDYFASVVLGFLYGNGKGAARNYKQTAYWWNKAAKQGAPTRQNGAYRLFLLGLLYYKGLGVPQDSVKAEAYWEQSEKSGEAGVWVVKNCLNAIKSGSGFVVDNLLAHPDKLGVLALGYNLPDQSLYGFLR